MAHIIIFNPEYSDHFIHTDTYGMIQEYREWDEAVKEGKRCLDGNQYRSFLIYKEDIYKIPKD